MNGQVGKSDELGRFLRARRAEVTPAMVGLPPTQTPRRVPGLRREEVAQLASLSADYYRRLEQGRLRGASRSALKAIADALRMSQDQIEYLYQLADKPVPRSENRPQASMKVHKQTQRMIDNLIDTPAMVIDRTMNILAWNYLASIFYTDFSALPPEDRNLIKMVFLHPEVRGRYLDWESNARDCVAFLRMDSAESPSDPALKSLSAELSRKSSEFKQWWIDHDVALKSSGTKAFTHPVAGEVELDWQFLVPLHEPEHFVLVMTAEHGTKSHQAIRFLASWSGERIDIANNVNAIPEGKSGGE